MTFVVSYFLCGFQNGCLPTASDGNFKTNSKEKSIDWFIYVPDNLTDIKKPCDEMFMFNVRYIAEKLSMSPGYVEAITWTFLLALI